MVIPSTPALPLFLRTRFHAVSRFSRLHTSSISCSAEAGLSGVGFAADGSALAELPEKASPSPAGSKATEEWVFCRWGRRLVTPSEVFWLPQRPRCYLPTCRRAG